VAGIQQVDIPLVDEFDAAFRVIDPGVVDTKCDSPAIVVLLVSRGLGRQFLERRAHRANRHIRRA